MGFIRKINDTKLEKALEEGNLKIGVNESCGQVLSKILERSEELGIFCEINFSLNNSGTRTVLCPVYANEYFRIGVGGEKIRNDINGNEIPCREYGFIREGSDNVTLLYFEDQSLKNNGKETN